MVNFIITVAISLSLLVVSSYSVNKVKDENKAIKVELNEQYKSHWISNTAKKVIYKKIRSICNTPVVTKSVYGRYMDAVWVNVYFTCEDSVKQVYFSKNLSTNYIRSREIVK